MSLSEVWRLIHQSRTSGVSFEKIAELRKDDPHGGIKAGSVWHWQKKLLSMYRNLSKLSFVGASRISVVTDASTHSCRDYLVTCFFETRLGMGAYGTSQHIRTSKMLFPGEQNLTEEAERLAARREIDRLSALKFLQALSAQLQKLTGLSIQTFQMPQDVRVLLQPMTPGDTRTIDVASRRFLVNDVEVGWDQLLNLPVMHVLMDQSKIGCAAAAWVASESCVLAHWTFDKVHRLLRDLKGPLSVCGLHQSVMSSTWVWSVNYKPFNSGAYFAEKNNVLESFLQSVTPSCAQFQEYKHRIAWDYGLQSVGDQELFDMLPTILKSWMQKGGVVKGSRWFSWNEQASAQLQEFSASRMVLEWYLASERLPSPDDDPVHASSAWRESSGLKLMYRCLSWSLLLDCHLVFRMQWPLWNYYSNQIHFVKSPHDGIVEMLAMVGGQWRSHSHLQELSQFLSIHSVFHFSQLVEHLVDDMDDFLGKVNDYTLKLLSNRCQTFSKYASPPECWAPLLGDDANAAAAALVELKKDWKWLQQLELATAPMAAELATDIHLVFDNTCRYLCTLAEFDVEACKEVLELIVGGFADSKIVEDCHQALRVAANPGSNKKLSAYSIQNIVQMSEVLEKRHIDHKAAIDEEVFMENWPSTRATFNLKNEFKASATKLPEEYSKILCKKTWPTVSEVALSKATGAWMWFKEYCGLGLSSQGVKIQAPWGPKLPQLMAQLIQFTIYLLNM